MSHWACVGLVYHCRLSHDPLVTVARSRHKDVAPYEVVGGDQAKHLAIDSVNYVQAIHLSLCRAAYKLMWAVMMIWHMCHIIHCNNGILC